MNLSFKWTKLHHLPHSCKFFAKNFNNATKRKTINTTKTTASARRNNRHGMKGNPQLLKNETILRQRKPAKPISSSRIIATKNYP